MKNVFRISTVLCIFIICISGCTIKNKSSNYGGDPMEFTSFKLTESGTTAQNYVYEGYITDSGVYLEYAVTESFWNQETNEYTEHRAVIRSVDGDKELYQKICEIMGNCRVNTWKGFHGANPGDVLDGSSMSFEALLADGTEITASGSNHFPENYGIFKNALHECMNKAKVTDTHFTDGTYEITLPESWIGLVNVTYSEGLVSFSVEKTDTKELSFLIIDNTGIGYSSESYPGRVAAGRLISDDDQRFITIRDNYSIHDYKDKVTPDVFALSKTYEKDKQAILNSIQGINGYTFYPEDGSVLYLSDATELSENAKSLWLYFNFAGEYTAGEEPVSIDNRHYIPMNSPYGYMYTIEQLKETFLQVFSEELTDTILQQAIQNKDIMEYNDSVYVACKKKTSNDSYHSWVESVKDNMDGTFAVVMAVKQMENQEMLYIDFPVEKNADGRFVFTKFPYWQMSE